MKCFFLGHRYGPVDDKGWQYCERCGKAFKPNPCKNGHLFEEVARNNYSWSRPYTDRVYHSDIQVAYRCSRCGKTKEEWLFGGPPYNTYA